MNDKQLIALTEEIAEFKRARKYVECIERMNFYEREEKDATTRNILLTAKATCNMQLGNSSAARDNLSRINWGSLTLGQRLYVDIVLANVLQDEGKLSDADNVLSISLERSEIYEKQNSEILYEVLARKGFILADAHQFGAALEVLNRSLDVTEKGFLHDNILIYRGYCLQALGHLQEAEVSLQRALNEGSGDFVADTFYRLGAVYLQKSDFERAKKAFKNAEKNISHGRIRLADVLMALSQAFRESGDIGIAEQYLAKANKISAVQ